MTKQRNENNRKICKRRYTSSIEGNGYLDISDTVEIGFSDLACYENLVITREMPNESKELV